MRIGADIGGTFTDIVLEDSHGMSSTKVLTTYDAPERGVLEGVRQVVEEAGAHGAASDDHALRLVAHGVPLSCSRVVGMFQ